MRMRDWVPNTGANRHSWRGMRLTRQQVAVFLNRVRWPMDDWNHAWRAALSAAGGKINSRAPDTEERVREITEAQKKSLESLLDAFAAGKIDRPTLDGELADEKRVLKAELLAARSMTRKKAQDATTAFFSVIRKVSSGGAADLARAGKKK